MKVLSEPWQLLMSGTEEQGAQGGQWTGERPLSCPLMEEQQHQAPAQGVEGVNAAQRSIPESAGVKIIIHNVP